MCDRYVKYMAIVKSNNGDDQTFKTELTHFLQ